jgi:hypothetical protein
MSSSSVHSYGRKSQRFSLQQLWLKSIMKRKMKRKRKI